MKVMIILPNLNPSVHLFNLSLVCLPYKHTPSLHSNSLIHSLTHSCTYSLTHSFTHSLTHSHTHTHTLPHSLPHSRTHTHTHTHSHTHTLTHCTVLSHLYSFCPTQCYVATLRHVIRTALVHCHTTHTMLFYQLRLLLLLFFSLLFFVFFFVFLTCVYIVFIVIRM